MNELEKSAGFSNEPLANPLDSWKTYKRRVIEERIAKLQAALDDDRASLGRFDQNNPSLLAYMADKDAHAGFVTKIESDVYGAHDTTAENADVSEGLKILDADDSKDLEALYMGVQKYAETPDEGVRHTFKKAAQKCFNDYREALYRSSVGKKIDGIFLYSLIGAGAGVAATSFMKDTWPRIIFVVAGGIILFASTEIGKIIKEGFMKANDKELRQSFINSCAILLPPRNPEEAKNYLTPDIIYEAADEVVRTASADVGYNDFEVQILKRLSMRLQKDEERQEIEKGIKKCPVTTVKGIIQSWMSGPAV